MQKFSKIDKTEIDTVAITLDTELLERAGLTPGQEVIVEALNGVITITPVFLTPEQEN